MRRAALTLTLIACALLNACATAPSERPETLAITAAPEELPESELLDVGIEIFDPGAITGTDIRTEIRKAEARFIPVHLKNTLQKTGYWGAVRVLPQSESEGESEGESESKDDSKSDKRLGSNTDVLIKGVIEASDGEELSVAIAATDASGETWFEKSYRTDVALVHYEGNERAQRDAFQDLYNEIANDLAAHREGLDAESVRAIRRIAALRFAANIAPNAFGQGYLVEEGKSEYSLARLPARDDPMYTRVLKIRERDHMLVDAVNGYYDSLYADMWEPYAHWRKFRNEEAAALKAVKRKALTRKALGAAAIAGAIALEAFGVKNVSTLQNVMIVGGVVGIKSGFDVGAEAEMHEAAIQELAASFEAEVAPIVVEIEGETVELTGSAETQYQNWRELLQKIYRNESGFEEESADVPVDDDATSERL